MNNEQKSFFPPQIAVCVGAVVLQRNKVLFVRQTYGGLKGRWSLPWGLVDGKNADGTLESPDTATIREIQEEAGIVAKVQGLLGIQNHSNNGKAQLYIVFLCQHFSGEPTPDNQETDKAAYFSLEEMANFTEPFDEFCEWMARRVLEGHYHVIPLESVNPYHPYLAFF